MAYKEKVYSRLGRTSLINSLNKKDSIIKRRKEGDVDYLLNIIEEVNNNYLIDNDFFNYNLYLAYVECFINLENEFTEFEACGDEEICKKIMKDYMIRLIEFKDFICGLDYIETPHGEITKERIEDVFEIRRNMGIDLIKSYQRVKQLCN